MKGKSKEEIEERKYSQKDVKYILKFKVKEGIFLTLELQIMLLPILEMKKILHKFQDITRTDFHPVRIEFMNYLMEDAYDRNAIS